MNRLIPALIFALALPMAATAQPAFVEGKHYRMLDNAPARNTDGKIEVVEVFWYGCPSCFSFEPHINRWKENLPEDVMFNRVAASMSPSWRVHARAYYTAEALGVLDKTHGQMFRALHIDRRPLSDGDALSAFFAEHGVGNDEFRRTFASFTVETRMRQGDNFTRRHRLTAVPSIVVAGKYRTDAGMAESFERLILLIDYLVEKERQAAGTTG